MPFQKQIKYAKLSSKSSQLLYNLISNLGIFQERKLRERSEELCRQTRLECEAVAARSGQMQDGISPPSAHKEVASLRNEVERLEVQYNESLNQQQSRYGSELSSLREQLQESEARRTLLEREVAYFFC